jgi:predicted Fe-Mo cluster-binding NifX family protein
MKIAVASTGKKSDSKVSSVSGRAPFYLIFENDKLVKVISNPFRIGGGGAGFGVAKMLINENVEMVISGNFGPNLLETLKEKNIKIKIVTGRTVEEAIKDAKTEV